MTPTLSSPHTQSRQVGRQNGKGYRPDLFFGVRSNGVFFGLGVGVLGTFLGKL